MGSMPGMDMGSTEMGSTGTGGHVLMGAKSTLLGGDAGDVRYPYFLINGRRAGAPAAYHGKPGTKVRLRIINAGGDTAFRVALGGHRMTVTHTDGFPVKPVDTDALLIGMGERYDVLVTLADGVFPLVALAEGKNATALGLVRTGSGRAPAAGVRPKEINGKIIGYADLTPADRVRLTDRRPDRTIRLELTGGMQRYDWAINGKPYDPRTINAVRSGERVRIDYVNTTDMWHPMHLHGHTFAAGNSGLRKDTAIVRPKQTLTTTFDADNPGIWMIHCHNVYHAEAGMMTLLGYQQ
jgi:FtsP/CotA-like multicopper oxidase with cupredoxin domain